MPWNTLDSLGHIHEVLAGSYYQQQEESVPEQTWSSAGLLDSAVRGLLGIEIEGSANRLHLMPHLPAEWGHTTARNIRLPQSVLAITLAQSFNTRDLEIENQGSAAEIVYEPEIPLGSRVVSAAFDGQPVALSSETFSEDQHAKVLLKVPHGVSHCELRLQGGVSVLLDHPRLLVGDPSKALKVTHMRLHDRELLLDADIAPHGSHTFRIQSPWKISRASGANFRTMRSDGSPNEYEITLQTTAASILGYSHTQAKLTFDGP